MILRATALVALAALLALPAKAGSVDMATVQRCAEAALEAGDNPSACVTEALAVCHRIVPEQTTAAIACYSNAKTGFETALSETVDGVKRTAPGRAPALAIVAKYDLLSAMLQCDRGEELSRLTELETDMIQRQKAACDATAVGVSWLRLWFAERGR